MTFDALWTLGLLILTAAAAVLVCMGAAWLIHTVITVDAAARWVLEALG